MQDKVFVGKRWSVPNPNGRLRKKREERKKNLSLISPTLFLPNLNVVIVKRRGLAHLMDAVDFAGHDAMCAS